MCNPNPNWMLLQNSIYYNDQKNIICDMRNKNLNNFSDLLFTIRSANDELNAKKFTIKIDDDNVKNIGYLFSKVFACDNGDYIIIKFNKDHINLEWCDRIIIIELNSSNNQHINSQFEYIFEILCINIDRYMDLEYQYSLDYKIIVNKYFRIEYVNSF